MTNFFDRIMQFADYKGFKNPSEFAKKGLGWTSSEKINRLKKENNKPSVDILIEISNKFEDINLGWLLTGKGEMLKTSTQSIVQNGNANVNNGHNVSGQGNVIKQTNNELMEIIREKDRQIAEKDKQIAMLIEKISK